MFVLKGILRAESQEKILIYLLLREKGYGKAIAEFYGSSQNAIQKQLIRMEEDGVVVSRAIGKLQEYELNPRYPFLVHLTALIKKAIEAYPQDLTTKLTMTRNRPRKAEKPVVYANETVKAPFRTTVKQTK
ncbi:winged helix-turn-helix domain-containing protein [Simiduia curdlanivorans]|uniref:Winged helix-turn-helix domain-containing protein n=1 Tax=Simiduia curdlanivorans TaxID=1492769 RepID=A0ABV8V678_9GAMM|nr:winged helix-turn-helix domain-containing protein [Simiduia curdlanivorans]MDN3638765.1 winged helix-turn-helix domain-containing protein [Simiduia curdlanivorans]